MGTYTAQILVGRAHPYHGGIQPTHQMFLSENSRPAWVLHAFSDRESEPLSWVPTVEKMLEDGLLLLGYSLLDSTTLRQSLPENTHRVECYDLDEETRERLYMTSRKLTWGGMKLVVTVLDGSHIERQLAVLDDYPMPKEICVWRKRKRKKQRVSLSQ